MASLAASSSASFPMYSYYGEPSRPGATEPTYHAAATIIDAHTDGAPIEAAPVPAAPEPRRVAALFSRPLPANPPYYYGEPPALLQESAETTEAEGDEAAAVSSSCMGYGWRGTSTTCMHVLCRRLH